MKTLLFSILLLFLFIFPTFSIVYQPEPVMPSIEFKCTVIFRRSPCVETLPAIGIKKDGSHQQYVNGCVACQDKKVQVFYRLGPCPGPTERRCTDFEQPICGRLGNGALKPFKSECEACNYNGVHCYLARNCP
jgi:hypothetical protein